MGSMRTSTSVIDPCFDGSMAHRSLDEASMETKSHVDDTRPWRERQGPRQSSGAPSETPLPPGPARSKTPAAACALRHPPRAPERADPARRRIPPPPHGRAPRGGVGPNGRQLLAVVATQKGGPHSKRLPNARAGGLLCRPMDEVVRPCTATLTLRRRARAAPCAI